jgi:hypothetical protein
LDRYDLESLAISLAPVGLGTTFLSVKPLHVGLP